METVSDVFEVRYGHSLELNRLKQCPPSTGIAFVSRKSRDNGIAAYVEPRVDVEPAIGGQLTCALSGNGVLSTFIQDGPFYTAFHVACLAPKRPLNKAELLYYCLCIKHNRYRYSYGRQANRTLKDILIPSRDEIPESIKASAIDRFVGADRPVIQSAVPLRAVSEWSEFQIQDLFEIKKGKRLTSLICCPVTLRSSEQLITITGSLHPLVSLLFTKPIRSPSFTTAMEWRRLSISPDRSGVRMT